MTAFIPQVLSFMMMVGSIMKDKRRVFMRMQRRKDGQYRIDKVFSRVIWESVVFEDKKAKGGINK